MIANDYFLKLYENDISSMMNCLRKRFIINEEYYKSLMDYFPLTIDGYVEFSFSSKGHIRFFFVYYDDKTQDWIDSEIYHILKKKLKPKVLNKTLELLELFDKIDPVHVITYGADITMPCFKLYIVSGKILPNINEIARIFNFPVRNDLENLNMLGLNIYEDHIVVKLYLIYNFPNSDIIRRWYPAAGKLSGWSHKISNIEMFFSMLPQKMYETSVAFPTLFNENSKKALIKLPESKGIFLKPEIYPSWIGFGPSGDLQNIYFRPKRDYLFKDDNKEITFKDKVFEDYKHNGDI